MTFSKPTRRPISGEEEHILLEFARSLSGSISPASIAAYQSDIRLFAENTPGVNLLHITDRQEDEYFAKLQARGFKRRTLGRKGTALRYFRQFLSGKRLAGQSLAPLAALSTNVDRQLGSEVSVFKRKNKVDAALSAFICAIQENHSPATIRAYTCDLLKFREHLRDTARWEHVSKQLVADFINEQVASGLNANSTARLLSTIRSLFAWLQRNGYVVGNPTLRLRVPRSAKRLPIPSIADLEAVESAEIPSQFSGLRDLLIFELLFRCGLRVSEVSSLNLSSVDLKRQRLMIQGRRSRRRYIDLPEFLSRILASYLPEHPGTGDDNSAPLVVNLRGGRLTSRSIGRLVKQIAISHKLPEGTHPHSLRHAYASLSFRGGKDVQDIRHGLGVSGISAVLKISN